MKNRKGGGREEGRGREGLTESLRGSGELHRLSDVFSRAGVRPKRL